jgi:hypothetical protein
VEFGLWLDRSPTLAPSGGNAMEKLRGYLASSLPRSPQPEATVWSSEYTKRLLQFYQRGPFGGPRWHAHVRVLDRSVPPAPGDYIVTVDYLTCTFCIRGMSPWTYGTSPRTADWEIAWRAPTGNVVVYRQR